MKQKKMKKGNSFRFCGVWTSKYIFPKSKTASGIRDNNSDSKVIIYRQSFGYNIGSFSA